MCWKKLNKQLKQVSTHQSFIILVKISLSILIGTAPKENRLAEPSRCKGQLNNPQKLPSLLLPSGMAFFGEALQFCVEPFANVATVPQLLCLCWRMTLIASLLLNLQRFVFLLDCKINLLSIYFLDNFIIDASKIWNFYLLICFCFDLLLECQAQFGIVLQW